jgi:hypothetical protein
MDSDRQTKVERAIAWYRINRAAIEALLPLDVPHGGESTGFSHYPGHWALDFWIDKWESGDRRFSLDEAEQLICAQLRPLYPVVRETLGV